MPATKRRTGYQYADSTPRGPKHWPTPQRTARVREHGTVKAQLLGKLGAGKYGELMEKLK